MRIAVFTCLLLAPLACPAAHFSATISGRVLIDGNPAPGISVVLSAYQTSDVRACTTSTGDDGRYRFIDVAPGKYTLRPATPGYVVRDDVRIREVMIAGDENLDGLDFEVSPGGVITGTVTDPDGEPVVEAQVSVCKMNELGGIESVDSLPRSLSARTDDRGIYRLYDIRPGIYFVAAGSRQLPVSYYPGVRDKTKGKAVQVESGAEISGIDIQLGQPVKNFRVTGRIVDSDSGRPAANISLYLTRFDRSTGLKRGETSGSTNYRGVFILEGLDPGHYTVCGSPVNGENYYGDPAPFDITDADVDGIEGKVHSAGSIAGSVVIDGNVNPICVQSLDTLYVLAQSPYLGDSQLTPVRQARVASDSRFQITGLAPGRIFPTVYGRGFHMLQIGRDGALVQEVDVGAGEQVSGVQLVVACGTGSINGTVQLIGASYGDFDSISVTCLRLTAEEGYDLQSQGQVDTRGRFTISNLPEGQYRLEVGASAKRGDGVFFRPDIPAISVQDGTEAQVVIILDRTRKN